MSETPLSPHECYNILRELIRIEVSFIQQRIQWLGSIQGLLFAGYVFSFSPITPDKTPTVPMLREVHILQTGIAVVGVLSSLFILFGLMASRGALQQIATEWKRLVPNSSTRDAFPYVRPGPTSLRLGQLSTKGMCFLFVVVWIVIMWSVWKAGF